VEHGFALLPSIQSQKRFIAILMLVGATALLTLLVLRIDHDSSSATKLSQAKAIALACKLYATDGDGSFPASLEELVPKYFPENSAFADFDYFGGKDTDSPNEVLLRSRIPDTRYRIVIQKDLSGHIIREP
jgi:hypothetical protein